MKRKYQSKSELLDRYGELVVKLESDFGFVVGLDRCRSVVGHSVSYVLFVNGLSYKFPSLRDVVGFMRGYVVASGVARDVVCE